MVIFILLTYASSATTSRDLMMMRTAVFGSIFTLVYNVIKSENIAVSNLNVENFSLLYFKGNEFAPHSFLHDDRASVSSDNHCMVENDYFQLSSSIELSVMKWTSYSNEIIDKSRANLSGMIYSITPIFRYQFKNSLSSTFKPFLELGVGGSLMDHIVVEERNKSTQFQFNDNIGIGLEYGRYIVGYRFIHYSNLNIKKPNPSIDLHHIYVGFRF